MPNNSMPAAVARAKDYYDSPDADAFYYRVWGGKDIHVGMYLNSEESILEASHRTVVHLANKIKRFPSGTQVLDIGSGYGGSARYLAREKGHRVICLNLSEAQNERNRQLTMEEGLSALVDVVDGNFEDLPFDDTSFDVVWSQDAILHSGNRKQVFDEVNRVLRPGGEFIFTDPMQTRGADPDLISPVLDRIDLESLGTPEDYFAYAQDLGWSQVDVELLPSQLVAHYSRVLKELTNREEELSEWSSPDYLERMKNGLNRWIEAGAANALSWGIFQFKKPN